jgi:molybdate transport system permease protein
LTSPIVLSCLAGVFAVVAGFLPALALGWILARKEFRGKALVTVLTLTPLVLPPVVTGFLLLSAFGARSPFASFLDIAGVRIPFSFLGVALASTVVSLPLYVMSIRTAFEATDRRLEEVAASLGAPPRQVFWSVSVPLAAPGIAAGAVLTFARSLGEFGATIVLAGNIPGVTQTIPSAIYEALNAPGGETRVWALSLSSLFLAASSLVAFEALRRAQTRRVT